MAIKNLSDLESKLGLEAGTLQKAIDNEQEVEVETPDLVIRTPEQEAELQANHDREKKERYDAAKEKAVKDVINENLEKYGVSLDSEKKTFENFAEALQNKLQKEVGKPKEQALQELENDKKTLQQTLKEIQEEYDSYKQSTTQKTRQQTIDQKLDEVLPSDNLLIPKQDLKELFKARHQFEWQEDGNFLIKDKDGNVLKDGKTTSPLKIDQVAQGFVENYVKKADKGAGTGDSGKGGSTKTSYDKFVSEMEEKGHSEGSEAFNRTLQDRQKEGTLEL